MSLNWLASLKQQNARRRARDRLTARIVAHEAIRDACRRDLAAIAGAGATEQALAKRLCREIDKREHALRIARAELAALSP